MGQSPVLQFRVPQDYIDKLRDEARDRGTTVTAVMWERLGLYEPGTVGRPQAATPSQEAPSVPSSMQAEGGPTAPSVRHEAGVPAKQAPASCPHPKDRLRNVAVGKRCLDCSTYLR